MPEVLATAGVHPCHVVGERQPRPRRPAPQAPRVLRTSASTRSTTTSPRPRRPRDVTGHHFRHYPRPGQGRLTGSPTVGLSLVLISPRDPADAQALRDWGDFVHIRHIAEVAVPGYSMITPYENVTGGDPRFMHFYEMDTDDPERAFKAMTPLVTELLGAGTPSGTTGRATRRCASCTSTPSAASASERRERA